jgi:hypothetical protein
MSARTGRFLAAWGVGVLLAVASPAPAARAQGAPADTSVEGYVRSMADSTDRWFGLSAEAADTAGIDSARVWALAHPGQGPRRHGLGVSLSPVLGFNRAIGGELGGEIGAGASRRLGRVTASAQWTTGADTWFGGGVYTKRWMAPNEEVLGSRFVLRAGRAYDSMDRDYHDPMLSAVHAFVYGSDRSDYLRRDGASAWWSRHTPLGWLGAGARDEFESPLVTTATWTLFRRTPVVIPNLAAHAARVHEVDTQAGVRLPHLPITLEGHAWFAGGALGGDAEYTRLRVAAGGALALGPHVAFAPELEYGRLTGEALPQDAFSLGGPTLRSLDAQSLRGTGRALAHADFILTDPLQKLLGMQRAPVFPIQLGAFAGIGSVWGVDPVTGGPALTRRDWPDKRDWLAEAGLSVLYRPGLPHPDSFVRLDWAVPIGADGRTRHFYVSYTRALNFLQR